MKKFSLVALVALVAVMLTAGTSSARAGTLTAYFNGTYTSVNINTSFLPAGTTSDGTAQNWTGVRQDTPGVGGADATIPMNFPVVCVDLSQSIYLGATTSFFNVAPMLNSTTMVASGYPSVTFDATRTKNMEKLWGAFYSQADTANGAAAFQLAAWDIAFDNTLDLTYQAGDQLWVDPSNTQAGVTSLAESWLTQIKNDTSNALHLTPLSLLQDPSTQDLITPSPVPEPASLSVLALGGLGLMIRRKRR